MLFALLLTIGVCLSSCSDEPTSEEVTVDTDRLLSTLNITDAQSIFYKANNSRANDDEAGYYKVDASGKEVKLQIFDESGAPHNIFIEWMVKATDRYVFFRPQPWDIYDALGLDGVSENESIWSSIDLICCVDKVTGKIYKMPYCHFAPNSIATEENGYVAILGNPSGTVGLYQQIYMFDETNLTVNSILPEGQEYAWLNINKKGFIEYWGNYGSPIYKIKCPGGAIKVMEDITFLLLEDFYTIDPENRIYKLIPNGNNDLTPVEICACPNELGQPFKFNEIRNTFVFENYEFNGTSFNLLPSNIPYEFISEYTNFNASKFYETNVAWYIISENKLIALNKSDYTTKEIPLTEYQLLEVVSNVNEEYLSFVGIRYSDSMKVIGKIFSDNSFQIEMAMSNNQNIYNLIPLN